MFRTTGALRLFSIAAQSTATILTPSKTIIKSNNYQLHKTGQSDTLEFSLFFDTNGKRISPWHDIPLAATGKSLVYHYINEIPLHTKAKMEVSTKVEHNPIKQDVKKGKLRYFTYNMHSSGGIPFNYGLLPQTFEDPESVHPDTGAAGDADPVDVVEIGTSSLEVGGVYEVKILGVLAMIDEGETDWKLIGIRTNDERAKNINSIADLMRTAEGETTLNDIRKWFRMYKTTDGKPENDFAFGGQYKERDYAHKILEETHHFWKQLLVGKIKNTKKFWLPTTS